MDILKAAIEEERSKKRRVLERANGTKDSSSLSSSASTDIEPPKKKYISRREIEKIREQEYIEQQKQQEEARRLRSLTRSSSISSSSSVVPGPSDSANSLYSTKNPQQTANASGSSTPEDSSPDVFNIPAEEIKRRFRARGQPIRLFGETDRQRIIRLRQLEANSEKAEGQRNEFMKAVAETEARLTLEILKGSRNDHDSSSDDKARKKLENLIYNPDYDTSEISSDLLKTNPDRTYILVYVYLRRLLHEWEQYLDDQPEYVKRSTQGKLELAKVKQTGEYLKPFFKLLKKKSVEPDVMEKMVEIMHYMHQREYVMANDSYLRLSIGNAPWPIGVTMVGIHERSAREKLFSSQVAHVLNDETQRKWIQSVKRLMTFCQTKYPPDDLAKLVG